MIEVSKKSIQTIFKKLLQQEVVFGNLDENGGIISFLELIWDLKEMPSQDNRFKNAFYDIYHHTVINEDWDYEYLFIERLNLIENQSYFFKFLEAVVSPKVRENKDDIYKFVLLINGLLEKEGFKLLLESHLGGLPVYLVKEKSENDNIPVHVKKNGIPFFVEIGHKKKPSARDTAPHFILTTDSWDDFSYKTYFHLYFFESKDAMFEFGGIKIMEVNQIVTSDIIPDKFYSLSENYCSLGQGLEFYTSLKKQFGDEFESILLALRDVAFFPETLEKFEKTEGFKQSLIRFDQQERLVREVKYEVEGYDLSNLYKFNYIFKPKYAQNEISLNFDFDTKSYLNHRIYTLIGKNGTGKTQFLSSLPLDLYYKKIEKFSPRLPLFSKVIAVSYSIFDKFEIPQKNAAFNYIYCGLQNKDGLLLSEESLIARFYQSIIKIEETYRTIKWKKILENFIDSNLIEVLFQEKLGGEIGSSEYFFSITEHAKLKNNLSSGQNIMLYIITEIIANIRYDSLILYDEPETHLHPNAVSQLMNSIYELVEQFESYCIIVTHSPLIIQELLSRNVYVIERDNDYVSVRRTEIESFGENLTTITEDVFGNRGTSKQYKEIIKKLVRGGKNFDEITEILEKNSLPLSLNASIYIKSQISNTNEKPETL